MTVKVSVLKVLIDNYPLVKTHKIHRAAKFTCSADVRFRELRQEHNLNIEYLPSVKSYRIHEKKGKLEKLLKQIAA